MTTNRNIQSLILESACAGLHAGLSKTRNAHKDTEKRLYAYPILLKRIKKNKKELKELRQGNIQERSKDIIRFKRPGQRLDTEDIIAALIQDLTASIAADEHETAAVASALETIAHDTYYGVIEQRYLQGKNDDDISEALHCDPSTVRRNRARLMNSLAVWLYGAAAL